MCIGENTSIEVLSLLHTLTKQYSFFKLRQPEQRLCNIDLEQNYLMESNFENKIQKSDTCLLVGINPRYEGFKLNLKLRSRSLKGNFKLIRIGSLTNLTFSDITITNSTKILKSLVEGNNLFCQEFINSYNPILVSNTEIFKRQDSTGFVNMLNFFTKYINLFSQSNQNSPFNILHPSLGSVGFSNFHNLKTIQNKDFKGANMIYFVNNSFSTSNIKKLLNLKLLNYFQGYNLESNLLITQSSHLDTKLIGKLKKGFFLNTHLHLPNAVFFETSGTYINTLGNMNKLNRIIKPLGQTKDN
jgi:NADH dehydrogenase/NADH:ubiquinone oxidoreductase subunit G